MVTHLEKHTEEAEYILSPEEENILLTLAETMIQDWDITVNAVELIQGGQLALV